MPYAWFNIDENNHLICIKQIDAGINEEVADVVFLTIKNYVGNALTGQIENQFAANFEAVCYADT